jgi:BirA family biotin operon repressor/biotin-[acetyl-CoA-carboxylase] ligase
MHIKVITPEKIQAQLKTNLIGYDIHHFPMIESTNEYLKSQAGKGAQDGLVAIAEVQQGGKGRVGRLWVSPSGGIWLSLLLRPKLDPVHAPKITLMTGVVVAQTIQKLTGLEPKLKWPNDVMVNEKKVCGILTEMSGDRDRIEYIVVGVGVNANFTLSSLPRTIHDSATTLQLEVGHEISRIDFIIELLNKFDEVYLKFKKQMFGSILHTWKQFSDTLGRTIEIATEQEVITGQAIDLGTNGELIIELENGDKKQVIAGDCIYLR